MEKDQNISTESQNEEINKTETAKKTQEDPIEKNQEIEVKEVTPEEKIKELEDKIARAFCKTGKN